MNGDSGLIAAIVGSSLGVIGGIVGTVVGVINTKPGAERAFALRVSAVLWLAMFGMLAWLVLVPQPYSVLVWVPFSFGLPMMLLWVRKKQDAIRKSQVDSGDVRTQ